MDIAGVREALHRQPFEPFAIRLADGRSLPVPHADFVALGARRIVVVGEDDSTLMIEPLLTTTKRNTSNNSKKPLVKLIENA